MFSNQLRKKPVAVHLFGQDFAFFRDGTKAYALRDRCPHRGIPLSMGRRVFPGTISCCYHGWTYNLQNGHLVAVLTDGPDSPICGKVNVETFPVEERAGIIWLYYGTDSPPPVEANIPEELLRKNTVIEGRFTDRDGDWRYAAENGIDEGHAKFLHRTAFFVFFLRGPAWILSNMVPEEGGWITRKPKSIGFEGEYPGLGRWPEKRFWKILKKNIRVSIRLPGILRVFYGRWYHFEWYIPVDEGRHRYAQIALKHASPVGSLLFRLSYWTYIHWALHIFFNNQDSEVVKFMRTPPEHLYRPDNSIIAWRKMCEKNLVETKGSAKLSQERPDGAQQIVQPLETGGDMV
jgi:phenylpropionate dioxygenase-like ring-hydroxylating dioxygenase large terminal subunit